MGHAAAPVDQPSLPGYVRAVLECLEDRLDAYAAAATEAGGQPETVLGPPAVVAERMLAALPEPSPWAEVLGPVYRPSQLARLLGGVSRQALADRERRGTLFALRTADGHVVYPAWQFRGGEALPGLAEVVRILRNSRVDDWTLAGWLRAGQEALGGRSVADVLAAGGDPGVVMSLASEAAARWAR